MQDITQEKSQISSAFLKAKRKLFDKVYHKFLNPEQAKAVFTTEGPVLVLAGAGSGKTTVLVNRICFLIKYGNAYYTDHVPEGVDADTVTALEMAAEFAPEEIEEILPQFIHEPATPWQVLAFTFTNKAAKEIKDRLLRVFDDDKSIAESVWAGTFHSVCLRILRKYGSLLGYRDGFSIYDTDDKKRMIVDCMKQLKLDEKRLNPKVAANMISAAKDKLEGPDEFDYENDPRARDLCEIYRLYNKKMMENNAVDFDDIIMRTVELLQTDDEVRRYYQRKFRYVLVDEYQDTNYAQFVLTKLLSDGYRNIMVVGDDDQSIYRFRGATVENILNFDRTYEDATVVKLEQNYRSTENILNAANAVIGHNENRHQKRLWSDKGEGEKIVIKEAFDQDAEGKYIVDKITLGVTGEKRKYSDYAVLYRVNAMGRSLQSAFTKSGTPFRVVGDIGFYDRKEVKDMVAYLSVIASTGDNLRLKRIINEPKRKIGAATVDAIEAIADGEGVSMFEVISRVEEYPVLSKSSERLSDFVKLITSVREANTLPSEILKDVFERSGYRAMLASEGFEGEGKIELVNELISAALEYEKRIGEGPEGENEPTLMGFLEEVFLVSDIDKYDENEDAVVLMTIHAAKGLEFPVVFLAGMEDGIFPSEQNIGDTEQMSEERRLAYVAITRAKERLFVTYAKSRMMYGRTLYGRLSQFVREEIPPVYTEIDRPRTAPPRQSYGTPYTGRRQNNPEPRPTYNELRRAPDTMRSGAVGRIGTQKSTEKKGAEGYGIERIPVGGRVRHSVFGEGTIISSRDMGGDILYEVRFDNGQTKKLMATFAKLVRI